jgi:hypothetical protein
MMRLLFLLLTVVSTMCTAQSYQQVDSIVRKYPRSFWSPEKLAHRIRKDFASDSLRARAVFSWISGNVSYDVAKYKLIKSRKYVDRIQRSIRPFNVSTYHRKVALATRRKRKGVCGDYSTLFQRMCDLLAIECVTISGTAKTELTDIGQFPRAVDHAWNAVKIQGQWRMIDVTWGAGGVDSRTGKFRFRFNDSYFFTPPDLFFLKHFASEKRWRFAGQTDTAFAALPLYHRLDDRFEVLSPSGVVNAKRKSDIEFAVRAGKNMNWMYYYQRDKSRFVFPVEHTFSDGIIRFSVPPPRAMTDYLTIYCDGLPLATFRVKSGFLSRIDFTGARR